MYHQQYVPHAQYAGGHQAWQQGYGKSGYNHTGHHQQQPNHGWQQQDGYQRPPNQYQQPYQQQLAPLPLPRQPQQQYQHPQQPQQQGPALRAAAVRTSPGANTPSSRPMKRSRFDTDKDIQYAAIQKQQQPQQHQRQSAQHIRWEVDKEAYPVNKQQQKLPHQQPSSNRSDAWLHTLRDEVLQFAEQVLPTAQEQRQRQAALSQFKSAVFAVLGHNRGVAVEMFGSGRAGLALHCSDIDVMITGLCQPYGPNGGYDYAGKREVAQYLRRLEKEARKSMNITSSKLIAGARIPVLKLQLRGGLELDASINNASGVSAANFLQSWQEDFSVLRPLVLVLKSILKQNGLGDVSVGGLGSWSLANMIIANLMAEDAAGGQVDHAGYMLLSFLKRYGKDWNVDRDAVAVAEGGIVPHTSLVSSTGGPFADPGKLAIKDPLSGREVAGGSHRYADVAVMWGELYQRLQQRGPSAASAARGGQYRVLSALFDCNEALRRSGAPWPGAQGYGGYGGGGNGGGYAQPRGASRKRDR